MGLLRLRRKLMLALILLLLVATVVLVFLFAVPQQTQLQQPGAAVVLARPCGIETVDNRLNLNCYWVFIEEFAEIRTPTSIRIAVSVISSKTSTMISEPLVYFPGGPGAARNSSGDSLLIWLDWYSEVSLTRPLVLLDYRHLPPSVPHYVCGEYRRFSQSLLKRNLDLIDEANQLQPEMLKCLQGADEALKTQSNPHPLKRISSTINAQDSQRVLQALGYSAWHILGVSYGSRVGLVAALTQPQVRSLILDSPYVFTAGQDSDIPRSWQLAISRYFMRCEISQACAERVQSEKEFWALMRELKSFPLAVHSENWRHQVVQTWLLNDVALASVLFNMLYSGGADLRITRLLDAIANRDLRPAKTDLEIYFNNLVDADFYDWLFIATECNDVKSETATEYEARIAGLGPWQTLFTGLGSHNLCGSELFQFQGLPAMGRLEIPVLVVVGEFDPVTPATDASTLLPYLSKGLLGVLKNRGHAEFVSDPCGKILIPLFLRGETQSTAELQGVQSCEWQ